MSDHPIDSVGDADGEASDGALTFCTRCDDLVHTGGKGKCPKCGCFLPENSLSPRRNPVNQARLKRIEIALLAEYKPTSFVTRSMCLNLAKVIERLDIVKPGSVDRARLISEQRELIQTLEASRPPRDETSRDLTEVSTDQFIERLDRVRAMAVEIREQEQRTSEPLVYEAPFGTALAGAPLDAPQVSGIPAAGPALAGLDSRAPGATSAAELGPTAEPDPASPGTSGMAGDPQPARCPHCRRA